GIWMVLCPAKGAANERAWENAFCSMVKNIGGSFRLRKTIQREGNRDEPICGEGKRSRKESGGARLLVSQMGRWSLMVGYSSAAAPAQRTVLVTSASAAAAS